jgi:hypothetical protein
MKEFLYELALLKTRVAMLKTSKVVRVEVESLQDSLSPNQNALPPAPSLPIFTYF